jgi:hypothetical protein
VGFDFEPATFTLSIRLWGTMGSFMSAYAVRREGLKLQVLPFESSGKGGMANEFHR